MWGGTYIIGHLPGKADFTNVVRFRTSWPYGPAVPSVTVRRGAGIGGVMEHDIALNAQDFRWSTLGLAGSYDVQAIVTHEVGHWWGLRAIYGDRDNRKTMYGRRRPAQTFRRSLEPEDREGIRWFYPGKPELFTLPRSLKSLSLRKNPSTPESGVREDSDAIGCK